MTIEEYEIEVRDLAASKWAMFPGKRPTFFSAFVAGWEASKRFSAGINETRYVTLQEKRTKGLPAYDEIVALMIQQRFSYAKCADANGRVIVYMDGMGDVAYEREDFNRGSPQWTAIERIHRLMKQNNYEAGTEITLKEPDSE